MFGKLPSSYRNHGNYDATVSKSQNRQMQLIRRFCIELHEDIWHNQQLNVEIILIFGFCDKLVVQGSKRDLIIALLEVYIAKKSFFLNKKMQNSCISSVEIILKYFQVIDLIASIL